jgi:hypothetical protein
MLAGIRLDSRSFKLFNGTPFSSWSLLLLMNRGVLLNSLPPRKPPIRGRSALERSAPNTSVCT